MATDREPANRHNCHNAPETDRISASHLNCLCLQGWAIAQIARHSCQAFQIAAVICATASVTGHLKSQIAWNVTAVTGVTGIDVTITTIDTGITDTATGTGSAVLAGADFGTDIP